MGYGTVLILGGYGETGRRIASRLASRTQLKLVIAGRNPARAEAAAAALRDTAGDRVRPMALDAADTRAVRDALEEADLLIDASTAVEHTRGLAEAALETGTDWLDTHFEPRSLAALRGLEERIREAGRCFIAQGGFHPGLPAVLVRWAAGQVDELREAWVAAVIRPRGGLPYTPAVDELLESFRHYRAHVYEQGRWRRIRFTRPEAFPRVDFEFGFGRRWTSPFDLEEMRRLPERIPTLRRLGFSIAGMNWLSDWIVTPLIMLALPLWGRRPLEPLGRLFSWSTGALARPPFGIVLQARTAGVRRGDALRPGIALQDEDGYDLTAIPVVALVEQMLSAGGGRPGLHLMGQYADPEPLLEACAEMGVQVRRWEDPA